MEMCVDNPREEFSNLFATHPSVDDRVAALVKFAGGHDPGKLELPPPTAEGEQPFLPSEPPITLDGNATTSGTPPDSAAGPWGSPPGPWGPRSGA
jgi:heat shock protein HtpX